MTSVLKVLAPLLLAAPLHAAIFNDVLPGAAPMGMGTAYTGVADGPYAMYYNPAGLAGSNFTEGSLSVGRMFSPVGPLAFVSGVYTRPFPLRPGSTVGAAYYDERQTNGGDKDEMMFHYSEAFRFPQYYITRPLKTGINAKIVSVKGSKGNKLALGLDGGVLMDTDFGLKAGASLLNLMPDVGVPNPWLDLGVSYLAAGRVTLSADLRVRRSLTQFFPGVQVSFFQGLLLARLGKGLPLDGVTQVAYGAGLNYSPVIVDFAMTAPWAGFTRPGGAYQISVGYKFGAPPFSGRFVGSAAREAEDLKREISQLEDRRGSLRNEVSAAETNKAATEGQLKALDDRLQTVQRQLHETERKLEEANYDLSRTKTIQPAPPPPAPKPPPKPRAPEFPRKYRVVAGDTLRSIAQHEYGDASLWELIYDANRDKIDRGLPEEGAELTLPPPKR